VQRPLLLEFDFTLDDALRSGVQRIAVTKGVFARIRGLKNAQVVREGKLDV
jgi:hypothetical protein